MSDLTPGEVARKLSELDRRLTSKVSRELYDRDRAQYLEDINEIKDSLRWGIRVVIAQFLAMLAGLIVLIVGRI